MVGGTSGAGASENDWYRLRQCESGNNYSTNTGNGYYGAYQFDLGTWHGVGGSGVPSNASKLTQDTLAHKLYRERGWSPWACASILGLRSDPSNGYMPVSRIKPTISAPSAKAAGSTVHLAGRATPGARVAIYANQVGLWKSYHAIGAVKANSAGHWAHNVRLTHTSHYFVKASGKKSGTTTTRYLYRSSIYGAKAVVVHQKYSIIGGARPHGRVTLYMRRSGGHSFVRAASTHANAKGHYRFGWRANTDYQYFVRSDLQSATGATRVATTAVGSVSVGRSASGPSVKASSAATKVALHGTARPGSLVRLYVRHAGQHAWRGVAKVHARRSGRWAVSLRAASTFNYFAKSSTGQKSHTYRVAVR